jgi:hypothetical protein
VQRNVMWGRVALAVGLVGALVAGCGAQTTPSAQPRHPETPPTQPCSPSVSIEGFSDSLDKTNFDNVFVGNLSGVARDARGVIVAIADRSVLFTLDPNTSRPVSANRLTDANARALDSEAVSVHSDGTLLITSETEPSVLRYAVDGRLLEQLPVPGDLRVSPAGRASGNLTFEGLARTEPDGGLVASMEDSLSGDQDNLVRWQTWTRPKGGGDFGLAAQYAYPVDVGYGISEITSAGDGRLLVVERDFEESVGNHVRLYLADPRDATPVSPSGMVSTATVSRPVGKLLLADLGSCPTLGATNRQKQVNPLLDNIEGMTVIGREPDGRLHLLAVSDDNQSDNQVTRLYWFLVRLPER